MSAITEKLPGRTVTVVDRSSSTRGMVLWVDNLGLLMHRAVDGEQYFYLWTAIDSVHIEGGLPSIPGLYGDGDERRLHASGAIDG